MHDYLDEIKWLHDQGQIVPVGRSTVTPFGTIYRALEQVYLLGHRVPRGHDFRYDLSLPGGRIVIAFPHFVTAIRYDDANKNGPLS